MQAGLSGGSYAPLTQGFIQRRPGLGVVQRDDLLTFADKFTFVDENLLDDAASEVIDSFALGFDGYDSRRGDAFIERRKRCPQKKAAESGSEQAKTEPHRGDIVVVGRS